MGSTMSKTPEKSGEAGEGEEKDDQKGKARWFVKSFACQSKKLES